MANAPIRHFSAPSVMHVHRTMRSVLLLTERDSPHMLDITASLSCHYPLLLNCAQIYWWSNDSLSLSSSAPVALSVTRPRKYRKKSLDCLVTDPLIRDVGVAKAAHRARFCSCTLLVLVKMESLVEPRLSGEAECSFNKRLADSLAVSWLWPLTLIENRVA